MSKQLYRCEITLKGDEFEGQSGGNVFVAALTAEDAGGGAIKTYREALKKNGFDSTLNFEVAVFLSNEKEVAEYQKQMGYRAN